MRDGVFAVLSQERQSAQGQNVPGVEVPGLASIDYDLAPKIEIRLTENRTLPEGDVRL